MEIRVDIRIPELQRAKLTTALLWIPYFPLKHTHTQRSRYNALSKFLEKARKLESFAPGLVDFTRRYERKLLAHLWQSRKNFRVMIKLGIFEILNFVQACMKHVTNAMYEIYEKRMTIKIRGFFSFLRGPLILKFKCLSMCF